MSLLSPQVVAFIAVIEEMSFERAARRLAVTPSAISQRIKQLEERVGQLLVVRQTPCTPTPAGERLLSRVKPMSLLEAEVIADFLPESTGSAHTKTFSIASNEDAMSTWLLSALADLHSKYGYQFDIRVDNEDFTLEHLKSGAVIGALTSQQKPLQGCVGHLLGSMRYCAIATPQFYQRYFRHGLTAQAFLRAPMLDYDHKDQLQRKFISMITHEAVFPDNVHYLPSAVSLVAGVKQEMGWCVTQEGLLGDALKTGELVNIAPQVCLNVPLYWQHAGVRSQVLEQITRAFLAASMSVLYR